MIYLQKLEGIRFLTLEVVMEFTKARVLKARVLKASVHILKGGGLRVLKARVHIFKEDPFCAS